MVVTDKLRSRWLLPWINLAQATLALAAHAIGAGILIGIIYFVERLSRSLMSDPIIFGQFPLHYIFDFSQFAVLITFLAQGVWDTFRILQTGVSDEPPQGGARDPEDGKEVR